MKMHKPTVTIALSAYNEEKNIRPFLRSILSQQEDGFKLEKILVISDGSTDKTVDIARSFKSEKIKVVDSKVRLGKSERLNYIYKNLKSDYLVQSDADVIYSHPFIVQDMIKPLINDSKVGMCGGHPQPVRAKSFTEKAINLTFEAYAPLRSKFRGGNNVFSVDGRILSYKKELVKQIYVPADMTANDAFTYYSCLTLGYQYRYVSSAVVYFRSPQTIADQIRQNSRFLAAPMKMAQHFPKEMIMRERHVPTLTLMRYMLPVFVKNPILSTYIFAINKYSKLRAYFIIKKLNAKWDMVKSTKHFSGVR